MNRSSVSAEAKREDGQRMLDAGALLPGDADGVALLRLHGALEDRLRYLLGQAGVTSIDVTIRDKDGGTRTEKISLDKAGWLDLARSAQENLKLADGDKELILEANAHRQNFAHGGRFEWTHAELVRYRELVDQMWASGSRKPLAQQPWPETRPQPPAKPRPQPRPEPHPVLRPWYRSGAFYWFTFLFLLPVWVFLILTDERRGALAKIFAVGMFGLYALGGFVVWTFATGNLPFLREMLAQAERSPVVATAMAPWTQAPAVGAPGDTPRALSPTPPATLAPSAAAPAAGRCRLEWVETAGSTLAGKSRSMVWNEVVSQQVQGSGMTWQEFSRLVVEKNPGLAEDGYEFRRGKVYLMPVCR